MPMRHTRNNVLVGQRIEAVQPVAYDDDRPVSVAAFFGGPVSCHGHHLLSPSSTAGWGLSYSRTQAAPMLTLIPRDRIYPAARIFCAWKNRSIVSASRTDCRQCAVS